MNQVNGVGGYLGGLAYRPSEDGRPDIASGAFDELVSGNRSAEQPEPAVAATGTASNTPESPAGGRTDVPVLVTYDWTGTLKTTEPVSGSSVNMLY